MYKYKKMKIKIGFILAVHTNTSMNNSCFPLLIKINKIKHLSRLRLLQPNQDSIINVILIFKLMVERDYKLRGGVL